MKAELAKSADEAKRSKITTETSRPARRKFSEFQSRLTSNDPTEPQQKRRKIGAEQQRKSSKAKLKCPHCPKLCAHAGALSNHVSQCKKKKKTKSNESVAQHQKHLENMQGKLREQSFTRKKLKQFHIEQNALQFEQCVECKERWIKNEHFVEDKYVCQRCQ